MMYRYFCWMLLAAVFVCGCERKDKEPETPSVKTPAATPPRAEAEEPETPPTPPQHAVIAVAQEFLQAVASRDFARAVALGTPGEFTAQGLAGMHLTFQLDRAGVAQAWVGTQQSAVVTGMIPMTSGSQQAAWGFSLVPAEDGRWLIRDADFLPTQDFIDRYLDGFRKAEPQAKLIEP